MCRYVQRFYILYVSEKKYIPRGTIMIPILLMIIDELIQISLSINQGPLEKCIFSLLNSFFNKEKLPSRQYTFVSSKLTDSNLDLESPSR